EFTEPRTVTIHFQKYSPEGDRFKYSLRARFTTAHRIYHAHHFDWDLHAALKGLLENLGKRIQKEKERRLGERKRVRSTQVPVFGLGLPGGFDRRTAATLVVEDFRQRKGEGATLQGGHDARDDFAQGFQMVPGFQRDHETVPANASGQRGTHEHQVHVRGRGQREGRQRSAATRR